MYMFVTLYHSISPTKKLLHGDNFEGIFLVPRIHSANIPNGISIESVVFIEYTLITNGQNDDGTLSLAAYAAE